MKKHYTFRVAEELAVAFEYCIKPEKKSVVLRNLIEKEIKRRRRVNGRVEKRKTD